LPTPVVDWVYVQLRETATGIAVSERSAFLLADGSLADDNGDPVVLMPCPAGGEGSYYIVVHHRNHLAIMSSVAHPLYGSSSTQYDFTLSPGSAYGTDPMNEVEVGLYGMVSGDVTCDGIISADDRIAVWNVRSQDGYLDEDCSLSGLVDASDSIYVWNCSQRATQVPNWSCQRL
jgi:hypothetical protein